MLCLFAQPAAPEPLSLERKPFKDEISERLRAAGRECPYWVSEKQLKLLQVQPRPNERPVRVPTKNYPLGVPFYNAEQLADPSAVVNQAPQFIDGEPHYGIEYMRLAMRHPLVNADQPLPCRWYTVPHGLAQAGLQATPDATVVDFFVGWSKKERRGLNLVSELHTMLAPMCDGDSVIGGPPAEGTADPLVPAAKAYHMHGDGAVFRMDIQTVLRALAFEHGYRSVVWFPYYDAVSSRFAPEARRHDVHLSEGRRFGHAPRPTTLVNGDFYQGISADEQLSGKGNPFRADSAAEMRAWAAERGFQGRVWFSALTSGIRVKEGEEPIRLQMGLTKKGFYNVDQLIDPPEVKLPVSPDSKPSQ